MIQLVNRTHTFFYHHTLIQICTIQLKLLQSLIERKTVVNIFIFEILSKMQSSLTVNISVLFNDVQQFDYHLCLRTMGLLKTSWYQIRLIFRKIGMQPNFNLTILADKDHLFTNIKISSFLIKNFEPLKSGFCQVKLILKRNVVDLFQS